MFKIISNILNNLWYVLSGGYKADKAVEQKFHQIWEKRMEQRMSPEFDWDTMTHPDDSVIPEPMVLGNIDDAFDIDKASERRAAYIDADLDGKAKFWEDELEELF